MNTEPGDTIISLGSSCQIYLFTGLKPASRYIYQASGAEHDPYMKAEFLADMEKRPKIIVLRKEDGVYDYLPSWYAPVQDMIAKEYRLLSGENNFLVFIRNEA